MVASGAQLEALGIHYLEDFDNTRQSTSPQLRLESVKQAAWRFRERLLGQEQVVFYQTIDLIRVPYLTKYGLRDACRLASPMMHLMNRLFVIQYESPCGLKTLLFSPSDIEANRETPYFKRLSEGMGPEIVRQLTQSLLAPVYSSVPEALDKIGLAPEQIDFIAYDHLHTQDIRRWLGNADEPGYFPHAKLLIMDQEWTSTLSLLPPQRDWYCPQGIQGIPADRVVRLAKSAELGKGIALVATPGHTEGNQSLVVHTPEGLFVTSENGISADSFAPWHSEISGLKDYVLDTGMDVVLNGNTLERGLDQYISMILEREIAGPAKANPDFFNVVPSSELCAYWAFPGLKPTFSFGTLKFGRLIAEKATDQNHNYSSVCEHSRS